MNALPDAASWPRVSELLDRVLDMPAGERGGWLDALGDEAPDVRDTLRRLLAAQARVSTDGFLGTLPLLQAPAQPPSHEPQPGRTVGPYRLISPLGQGGMGSVWLAERIDGQLKRQVALKLPHMGWDDNLAQRLARERDILATLEHPGIARLYDAGVDELGRPWMAMEYVAGRSIDVFVRERELDLPSRLRLLLEVCSAVAYAHSRLVIHRDLKPSNILVTDDARVKLLDFGIARLLEGQAVPESALTRQAGRALTLDYASPEQIRGEPLGAASDVYSLAVVAYELLCGRRPYRLKRGSAAELEDAIALADPPPASQQAQDPALRRRLRGDLDAILHHALKKDARARYPTVDAFAQDLSRHLDQQPVQARPDTMAYRAGKFARRYRLPLAAATLAATALTSVAAVAWLQAREARTQADRARTEAATAQAVQGFLEAVFRSNSADQNEPQKARDTTARELLDRGVARIDGELGDAPEARVRLLGLMGVMYSDMGLYNRDAELQQRRAALARETFGAAHVLTAEAVADHARALTNVEQIEPAMKLLDQADAILDALGDQHSTARFKVEVVRASTARRVDPAQAHAAATRAVAIARRRGPSPELVQALHLEGQSALDLGRYAPARDALREAIAMVDRDAALGRGRLLDLYSNLGEVQSFLGDMEAAEQSMRRALDTARNVPGTPPLALHTAAWNLAQLLARMGQVRESVELLKPAYEWARTGQSEVAYAAAMLAATYARYLVSYGDVQQALDVVDQLPALLRGEPDSTPLRGPALVARALALADAGRYEAAAAAAEEALRLFEASPGYDDWVQQTARVRRRIQLAMGQADAALADHQAEQARLAGQPVARAVPGRLLLLEVAQLHAAAGNDDAARAAASAVLAGIEADPRRQLQRDAEADALFVIGTVDRRQGRWADAAERLEQSVGLMRQVYDPQRKLALADAWLSLAACQAAMGQAAEARRSLAEALAIHARHRQVGRHHLADVATLQAQLASSSTPTQRRRGQGLAARREPSDGINRP